MLAVLFLRGPQTLGEIRSRCARIHDFPDLAAVSAVLDQLEDNPHGPYVKRPAPQPGRKEPLTRTCFAAMSKRQSLRRSAAHREVLRGLMSRISRVRSKRCRTDWALWSSVPTHSSNCSNRLACQLSAWYRRDTKPALQIEWMAPDSGENHRSPECEMRFAQGFFAADAVIAAGGRLRTSCGDGGLLHGASRARPARSRAYLAREPEPGG